MSSSSIESLSDGAVEAIAPPPPCGELFADQLVAQFARRLQNVANTRLPPNLRSKVSPEDVVQSVFKSVFKRLDQLDVDKANLDSLWGLLVVMTLRKCAKWEGAFRSEKRAVRRETSLTSSSSAATWEPVDRKPGPEEIAAFAELLERLLRVFPPRQQHMVLLRIDGYELNEIAQQLHSSRRTVARVVARAKQVATDMWRESIAQAQPEAPVLKLR